MKRLLLFTPLLCLLFAGPADATNCTSFSHYAAPVQNYGYQNYQSYAATYYTPVYYPVYSIGYTPPNNESLKEELLKLKVELRDLTIKQLEYQLKSGIAPQAEPVKTSPVVAIFQAKCASCHSEEKAKDSGGGFVLLKGGRADHLLPQDKLEIIKRVITNDPKLRMPKGGSLSDQEQVQIVQVLSGN